jgi:ADP-ribose pyrophosphatase
MLKRWQQLSTGTVFQNPWWTYKKDTFRIPGGVEGEYHYVYTRGSSMVIPVSAEGELLLVNQYRYLCDRESIEFPCGSVNEGDSHLDTAHHELQEETGFQAGTMQELGAFNPYNGVASEMCSVYLATQLTPARATPDATEEFELIRCSIADFERWIRENKVWDGMTLAAWMLARHRLEGCR